MKTFNNLNPKGGKEMKDPKKVLKTVITVLGIVVTMIDIWKKK